MLRFKSYVYLLHRESIRAPFLPLNVSEEVTMLELFHKEYVVITIQGKTLSSEDTKHIHSIVVKLGEEGPPFDIQGLLDSLSGASIECLPTEFEQKYVLWAKMDVETSVRRINSIFRVLNRFAIQNCAQLVVPPRCQLEWSSACLHRGSQSPSEASRSNPHRIATQKAPSRKRNVDTISESMQRKKRRTSGGGAGSFGSALTTLIPCGANRGESVEDYEKFAKIQEDFWKEYSGCYLFGMVTYEVDIAQCILGSCSWR